MANHLFKNQIIQMSQEFCSRLMDGISFGICAPVQILAQSLWDCIHTCAIGNDGIMFLCIAFDLRTRDAWHHAIACPENDIHKTNIQTVWLPVLEQRMAANRKMLAKMLSPCRRIIVWINPVDLTDGSLSHWAKIYASLPARIPVTYLSADIDLLSHPDLKKIHQDFEIIDFHAQIDTVSEDSVQTPISIEFNTIAENFDSSDVMYKKCRKYNTFVRCHDDWSRLKYAEWAHKVRIPVIEDISVCHENTIQVISHDISELLQSTPVSFRHLVDIDPDPGPSLNNMLNPEAADVTMMATSYLSLLSAIAGTGFPQEPFRNSEFVEIYHLFSELYHGNKLDRDQFDASCGDFGEQLLDHWIAKGYVTGKDSFEITPEGRHLFAGIQDFSQLGVLLSLRHKTIAYTANKDFSIDLDSDFLQQGIAQFFTAGGQPWERSASHILSQTASLTPVSSPVESAWLDAVPAIFPPHLCSRIEAILFSGNLPNNVQLSPNAKNAFTQLLMKFQDMKEHRCIETCQGVAHWWTFAGAQLNHLIAIILKIIAPKLHVSYGNLHLRLAWARSADNPAPEIERLKALSSQIRKRSFSEADQKALFELWQTENPYSWIFPLLPGSVLNGLFTRDMECIQICFPAKALPIHEVRQHRIIDIIPFEFKKLIHPRMMNQSQDTALKSQKIDVPQNTTPQNSKAPSINAKYNGLTSSSHTNSVLQSEHGTSPRSGIMHTTFPWTYVNDENTLNRAINIMLSQKYIGLDVETTLYDQSLCLIQIGCSDQVFMIDPLCVNFMGLSQVFANPNIIKIIHNSTFEKKVLGKYGLQIINIVDTLKWSRQIYGMKIPGGHSLKAVCMREFGYDMDKTNQQSRWEKRPLSDEQLEYAALDAEILIHLYRHFNKKTKGLL